MRASEKSSPKQGRSKPASLRALALGWVCVGSMPVATSAFVNTSPATTIGKAACMISSLPSSLQMFTGIVEEMGTVVSMEERDDMTLWDGSKGKGTELVVKGKTVLEDAYLGCSICVSGVCLTATEFVDDDKFKVGLAPETLRRTYFPSLKGGDAVNLERASEMGGRNSGHFVQGHVDGTGTIINFVPSPPALAGLLGLGLAGRRRRR